jgi:hypothetical protein
LTAVTVVVDFDIKRLLSQDSIKEKEKLRRMDLYT